MGGDRTGQVLEALHALLPATKPKRGGVTTPTWCWGRDPCLSYTENPLWVGETEPLFLISPGGHQISEVKCTRPARGPGWEAKLPEFPHHPLAQVVCIPASDDPLWARSLKVGGLGEASWKGDVRCPRHCGRAEILKGCHVALILALFPPFFHYPHCLWTVRNLGRQGSLTVRMAVNGIKKTSLPTTSVTYNFPLI